MALAVVDDSYSVASGAAVEAGRAALPAWAALASGMWAEVPMAATLADIDPIDNAAINPNHPLTPEWAENTLRQSQIVAAWCGAAYDEATDQMVLGLGGGHQDYAGNEIYRCGFFVDSPAWAMLRPPSGAIGNLLTTNDGQEASGLYSDGRPRATHGYNKWVHVPGVGPVLVGHGNASWSAAGGKQWAVFLDASGEASFTAEAAFTGNQSDGLGACYDVGRNAIWIAPRNTTPLYRYAIPGSGGAHTGSYTTVGSSLVKLGNNSLVHLPTDDLLVLCGSDDNRTTQSLTIIDCATGTPYTPGITGSGALLANSLGEVQWRWIESRRRMYAWNNSANHTLVTYLEPGADPRTDAWTMGTLPVHGSNVVVPSARAANGTYGRFAYSPRLGGFLVFNATTGPTYFYKL